MWTKTKTIYKKYIKFSLWYWKKVTKELEYKKDEQHWWIQNPKAKQFLK